METRATLGREIESRNNIFCSKKGERQIGVRQIERLIEREQRGYENAYVRYHLITRNTIGRYR